MLLTNVTYVDEQIGVNIKNTSASNVEASLLKIKKKHTNNFFFNKYILQERVTFLPQTITSMKHKCYFSL